MIANEKIILIDVSIISVFLLDGSIVEMIPRSTEHTQTVIIKFLKISTINSPPTLNKQAT